MQAEYGISGGGLRGAEPQSAPKPAMGTRATASFRLKVVPAPMLWPSAPTGPVAPTRFPYASAAAALGAAPSAAPRPEAQSGQAQERVA